MSSSLFAALEREPDARHQAVVDAWVWTPPVVRLNPGLPGFDAAFDAALEGNHQMVLDRSGVFPPGTGFAVLVSAPGLEVRAVPGKGLGLVATAPLARGSRLLAERGVLGTRERLAAALLACKARLESWSPFANVSLAEWNGALHMFRCNKFSLEDGLGYETHGLFPRLSRLNHSCSPSAVRHVVGNFALLFARRDVAAGEEVTMRYSPEEGHGKCTDQFTCGCRLTITQRRAASTADADAAKKFALAGGKPAAANPLVPRTAQPRPPGAGAGAPAKSAGAAKRPAAGPAAGAPPTGRPRVAAGGGGGARAVAAAAGRSSK